MLHPVQRSAQHLVHGSERRTYVHVGVTSPFLWADAEARVRHWPPVGLLEDNLRLFHIPEALTEGGKVDWLIKKIVP